jgi:hypothetical protein
VPRDNVRFPARKQQPSNIHRMITLGRVVRGNMYSERRCKKNSIQLEDQDINDADADLLRNAGRVLSYRVTRQATSGNAAARVAQQRVRSL